MTDNFKDKLYEEKEKVLKQVFEEHPELEKNKDSIYKKILGDKDETVNHDIVLEEFFYNDQIYYMDNAGGILDETASLIGFITDDNGYITYNFFDNEPEYKNEELYKLIDDNNI